MNGCRLRIEFENNVFTSRHGHVSICGESAYTTVNRRRRSRVVDVDVVITGKIWIEDQASQAALATASGNIYGHKRRREKCTVFNYPHPPTQLSDQNSAIRRKCH